MVKQLKVIVQDATNLGNGFITANFQQPILIQAGSYIALDKFYADTRGNVENFLLPAQTFIIRTQTNNKSYLEFEVDIDTQRFASVDAFFIVLNGLINGGISAFHREAITQGTPTLASFDLGYSLTAIVDGDNTSLKFNEVIETPINFPALTNIRLNSNNYFQPILTDIKAYVLMPETIIGPASVGDQQAYLLLGGGLSMKSNLSLVEATALANFSMFWGVDNVLNPSAEIPTKTFGILNTEDGLFAYVENDGVITSVNIENVALADCYAPTPNPLAFFQLYHKNSYWAIRYVQPDKTKITAGNALVVGRQYKIFSQGLVPTSYVSVGAASNAVNTIFTATGTGTGLIGTGVAETVAVDIDVFYAEEDKYLVLPTITNWYPTFNVITDDVDYSPGLLAGSQLATFEGTEGPVGGTRRVTNIDLQTARGLATYLGVDSNIIITPDVVGDNSVGTYTGGQIINFSGLKFEEELALELVDIPLESYSANGGKYIAGSGVNWGSRNNVLSYFTPIRNDILDQRYTFASPIYQWLRINTTTTINLASLSFRLFNVYSPSDPINLTSVTFNVLIREPREME